MEHQDTMDQVMNSAFQPFETAQEVKGSMMKRVCAWCGKDLNPSIPSEGVKTTHGICVSCANNLILKEKLRLQTLVDKLELLKE